MGADTERNIVKNGKGETIYRLLKKFHIAR
jgi:hypothetical protein